MSGVADQARAALIHAREVRSRRAYIKRYGTPDDVLWVIRHVPSWSKTWAIAEVIEAVPHFGPKKRKEILSSLEIGKDTPLGQLEGSARMAIMTKIQDVVAARLQRQGRGTE